MSRINGNNGPGPTTRTDSRSSATASMPMAAGSDSALIAQIAIRLQDSSDRSRDMRRTAQASQREATLEKIGHQREAALVQCITGIASSVGNAVSAGIGAAGGSEPSMGNKIATASAKNEASMMGAVGGFITAEINAAASEDELRAKVHGDAAQDHGADVQRLQAQMDRAMGAVDNLAQARNRAIDEAIG